MNAPIDFVFPQMLSCVAQRRARPLLGTIVEISAAGTCADQVQAAIERAFHAVATVHALMSYHDANSDISRINRCAFDADVEVHEHTWRVLSASREISSASGGLFDITIADSLVQLGFLPRHADFSQTNFIQARFQHHSAHGHWRHVTLLPGNRVRLLRRLRIDVSGIAKGYAVDVAIEALKDAGMTSGRVNAGGDLRLFGHVAQNIHVRHPMEPSRHLQLLELSEGAVATSAGYFNSRSHRGRRITPLIHPHTGVACGAERSVTIVAQDCMTADALTKVIHADPAQASGVLARFNARALMLEPDPVGNGVRLFDTLRQSDTPVHAGDGE